MKPLIGAAIGVAAFALLVRGEGPGRVTRLLEAIQASGDTPGYFFAVVGGHVTMPRFYPFRVR